ncbi:MAG: S41 family peptidase [Acidimicrobiia bacterium]
MRKALTLLVIIVVACGQAAETGSSTTAAPATAATPASTDTTVSSQAYEIQDCTAPPVTFSAMCQVYELVQQWHVDRPWSSSDLADVALRSLQEFTSTETEPRPRVLLCAVPHEDFADFCAELAQMVNDGEIAVGPAVEAAVTAMTDLGLDPFSYYVPPDQAGSFRANGLVGGVGLLLDATDAVGSKCARITATCPLQIVFVLDDNPGADAGLQAGDFVVEIDGEPVEGLGFAATATALAGDESGSVEIVVEREGGERLTITIERSELTVPTVSMDVPRPGVGYLRIPDFEDDIPDLVEEALISLSEFKPRTIVIDLRDNPGGFVDASVDVASEFISGGLVLESFAPDERLEYTATEGGLATRERLIVLVNRGTASAAEIVAGALRDRRDALLVGTNTFGKDAVQIPFSLRNGGELYVAVARWATPNGLTAGNGGLTPDRELELASDMSIEEVVQAALDAAS